MVRNEDVCARVRLSEDFTGKVMIEALLERAGKWEGG